MRIPTLWLVTKSQFISRNLRHLRCISDLLVIYPKEVSTSLGQWFRNPFRLGWSCHWSVSSWMKRGHRVILIMFGWWPHWPNDSVILFTSWMKLSLVALFMDEKSASWFSSLWSVMLGNQAWGCPFTGPSLECSWVSAISDKLAASCPVTLVHIMNSQICLALCPQKAVCYCFTL